MLKKIKQKTKRIVLQTWIASREGYEILKNIDQKTKRILFQTWMASCLTLLCLALVVYILSPYINSYFYSRSHPYSHNHPHSNNIQISKNSLTPSPTPTNVPATSTPVANTPTTFYGENIDMSQILPASQHYVVNSKGEDLIDIAADLGINFVRITNAEQSFNSNGDSVYTTDQWNQVLGKMQSKGIKALILIEGTNPDDYSPDIRPAYLNLVQEYIDSGVFSHPDVYAADIKNEPLLTDANINMLQTAHSMLKAKYPNLKQTIGWWATPQSPTDPYNPNNYSWSDYSTGQKLANLVDFYSIHMYDLGADHAAAASSPAQRTKAFISAVENGLQTTKPILIGEFGEADGDTVSDQDTVGSPQLQANVYQGVYQALKEMQSSQLMGSVAFDFHTRNEYPDAWAIVKNQGNYLFPAAYILQEYALGKNNPAPQTATTVTTQSYAETNAQNNSTQALHVSDRIGLKIHLDHSKTYSLSLSAQSILQPLASLYYNPASDSYNAVYQATSKGNTQLKIIPDCTTGVTCTTPVYTLTIPIQ